MSRLEPASVEKDPVCHSSQVMGRECLFVECLQTPLRVRNLRQLMHGSLLLAVPRVPSGAGDQTWSIHKASNALNHLHSPIAMEEAGLGLNRKAHASWLCWVRV